MSTNWWSFDSTPVSAGRRTDTAGAQRNGECVPEKHLGTVQNTSHRYDDADEKELSVMDNFNRGSTVITSLPADDSLVTDAREPASITASLAAKLFAPLLDRQLVAGAAPKPGSALAVHATRLTSAQERQRLATQLQSLLETADAWSALAGSHRSPRASAAGYRALWSSAIPLNWSGIEAESGLISQIEMRLQGADPVSARGIARLRGVLSSSAGPLNPYSRRDLSTELRAVLDVL
jgi:hypothetical protein